MGRWDPYSTVRQSELIGRRVFDKEQRSVPNIRELKYNIFLDTRYEDDLSVDRLGDGQPHRPTVTFLTGLCDAAAASQKQEFLGWVATQRKHVKFEEINPDALTIEEHGIANPYHALIDRSRAREKGQAFHLSRSLLMSFQENGLMVAPLRKSTNSPDNITP